MLDDNQKYLERKKRGKRNKAAGRAFEKKVREDLESKHWIVSKWQNNLKLVSADPEDGNGYILTAAKPGPFRMMQTGFPDFICISANAQKDEICNDTLYNVMAVECKSNGYLSPEERAKCSWYLEMNIFPRILIAKKGGKKGKVEYVEYKTKS